MILKSKQILLPGLLRNRKFSCDSIRQAYTAHEIAELEYFVCAGKPLFADGALGEFGLRRFLTEAGIDIKQNFSHQQSAHDKVLFYDWSGELGLVEVKSQNQMFSGPCPRGEIVLQGGEDREFEKHAQELDLLLIWSFVENKNFIVPLALVKPIALRSDSPYTAGRADGRPGVVANFRVLYEAGQAEILNDEWREKILHF